MESKDPYIIVLYNKTWDMKQDQEYTFPIINGFQITTDHAYLDVALAVVFHMPTLKQGDPMLKKSRKRKDQLWVFWSMECEAHYMWQYEPEIFDLFELKATCKLNSDIPLVYFNKDYYSILRQEPVAKKGLVNAFISSTYDRSNRLRFLEELMSFIEVDSYGKMFNNKLLANDGGFVTKNEVMSEYKFTIAFENAIAEDYVTEKFFGPLVVGSVPIYLGAPNIDDFAPGEKCFINAHSFPSAKALADFLLELASDNDHYEEYLKWKKLPFKNEFTQMARFVETPAHVKLCDIVGKHYGIV